MKYQMHLLSFFMSIITAWAPFCNSMDSLPSSPQLSSSLSSNLSSSPKTLFVYDQRENNYLLFKLLKKTPHVIDACIKKVHESEVVEQWQTPQTCYAWHPTETTVSPATIQGCYMEFCDAIPRALTTPWGRQPLFEGTTYHPFVKKMVPFLLAKITLAQQPDANLTSCWQTKVESHPTTFFEVITFNGVLLENPLLRKKNTSRDILKIMRDWDNTVERYEEEQEHDSIKQEMSAILSNVSPTKNFVPIKIKRVHQ